MKWVLNCIHYGLKKVLNLALMKTVCVCVCVFPAGGPGVSGRGGSPPADQEEDDGGEGEGRLDGGEAGTQRQQVPYLLPTPDTTCSAQAQPKAQASTIADIRLSKADRF